MEQSKKDYRAEYEKHQLIEEIKQEYYANASRLNWLDTRLAHNDFPECVGEAHGRLIECQYSILQSYIRVLELRLKDLGINIE